VAGEVDVNGATAGADAPGALETVAGAALAGAAEAVSLPASAGSNFSASLYMRKLLMVEGGWAASSPSIRTLAPWAGSL